MTDAAVQRLMAALGSDQESAEPAVRRVRREIPSYAEVSHERLVASVNRNRAMALRALATGRVPPPEEIWEAELATLEPLERTMADLQGRRDRLLLTMPLNGHIVGLVKDSSVDSQHHLVAVGTPVPLERLAESHRIAERVLASARLQFEAGVHTLESLGWQFAVPLVTELSALLRDRYIAPLRATGDFGDQAIAAVRSYLAHECSIPRTAEALFVHVNTLRYRLARFEELTGRSLRSTDTLVELSLVLHEMHLRSQLRRRGQSVGVTSVVADVTRAISLRGAAGSTTTAPVTSSS